MQGVTKYGGLVGLGLRTRSPVAGAQRLGSVTPGAGLPGFG